MENMRIIRKLVFSSILIVSSIAFSVPSAEFFLGLNPAGNFSAKTNKVSGFVTKKGDSFSAKNIVVDTSDLDTGVSLRNRHMFDTLEVEKYPSAVLIQATGKGGVGEGILKIRNVQGKINGTYKVVKNELYVDFDVSLKEFKFGVLKYKGIMVSDKVRLKVVVPIK
jgi:hypothetical protein